MMDAGIRRALLSVSDKSGLVELASRLAKGGVELISTGGTARALRAAGLEVRDVADVTGFPETMDGRVKTLHPRIHGGLLAARDEPEHVAAMEAHEIGPIDLLVVNLYPFEEMVARGAGSAQIIENIDIGGPAMIRSAAKNHRFVTVLTDPADYPSLLEELAEHNGATTFAYRWRMAGKAFARTASYDAAIAGWFAQAGEQAGEQASGPTAEPTAEQDGTAAGGEAAGGEGAGPRAFMPQMPLAFRLVEPLRYGENPHQVAALYAPQGRATGLAAATQVQGKALSYNNLNDADAALELIGEFAQRPARPAIAIIKHANPCGVAEAPSLLEAWEGALACDPVSAFGGVVAASQPLDRLTAQAICAIFTEVVIAPGADEAALAVFAAKPNLRLLLVDPWPQAARPGWQMKTIAGGLLMQSRDAGQVAPAALRVVSARQPGAAELEDALFAWKVAKHVKSNAIVFARGGATAGIGAGQMNRRDAARIAAARAQEAAQIAGWPEARTIGSAMASDAFLPFADGLEAAIAAGATMVIQPGGSLRDEEVIAAADAAGLAMVFTGMRHFRH